MKAAPTLIVLIVLGSCLAAVAGASPAKSKVQAKTFRGLVVIGCARYSTLQSICYATSRNHPEARSFYIDRKKSPGPGRVADVRGQVEGQLIDSVTQIAGQKTWTLIRGSASSTKVVGTVRSITGKKSHRTISFFVSVWTRCGHKPSYCMAEGVFVAKVPKKLSRTAEKAWNSSSRGKNAVFLLSLEFKRGKMSLTAIKTVPGNKRRP